MQLTVLQFDVTTYLFCVIFNHVKYFVLIVNLIKLQYIPHMKTTRPPHLVILLTYSFQSPQCIELS